jgi:hypothetical protein
MMPIAASPKKRKLQKLRKNHKFQPSQLLDELTHEDDGSIVKVEEEVNDQNETHKDERSIDDETLDEADDPNDEDYEEHLEVLSDTKRFVFKMISYSLRRKAWGAKKDREIFSISLHVAVFLVWTKAHARRLGLGKGWTLKTKSIAKWYEAIVQRPHTVLEDFASHLDDDHHKLPNTTKSYLLSLRIFTRWFGSRNEMNTEQFISAIACLLSQYTKAIKRHRSENRVEFDDLVQTKRIPPGGLQEMSAIIRRDIPQWLSEPLDTSLITRRQYKAFCCFMFAAFYVLTPQGRIGGFEDLKFDQLGVLFREGSIMSSTFKTGAKFGFQTFGTSTETLPIVKHYVEHLRPIAVRNGNDAQILKFDALWLNFNGSPLLAQTIGKYVTNYWSKKTKTLTSTTLCRSLVETNAHKAEQEGDISASERDAISGVNGHSGKITEDYYLLHDRKRDISLAMKGFQKMIPPTNEALLTPNRVASNESSSRGQSQKHSLEMKEEDVESDGYDNGYHDGYDDHYGDYYDGGSHDHDHFLDRDRGHNRGKNDDSQWSNMDAIQLSSPTHNEVISSLWSGFGQFLTTSVSSKQQPSFWMLPSPQNPWCTPPAKVNLPINASSNDWFIPPVRNKKDMPTTLTQAFGQAHPCKDLTSQRVKFSHVEIRYVGEFCSHLVKSTPFLATRMFAECLERIKRDTEVHQHFHPRHVENSERLRPALTQWERVNGPIMKYANV